MGTDRSLRRPSPTTVEVERVASAVVDSAVAVHRRLGPGLYESVYEVCLAHEVGRRGHGVERQVVVPVTYEGVILDAAFRIDLFVERSVIVEVKSVESLLPVHRAQLLTYLRLSGVRVGLLINFNRPLLREGLQRIVL